METTFNKGKKDSDERKVFDPIHFVAKVVSPDDPRGHLNYLWVVSGIGYGTDGHRMHWTAVPLSDGLYRVECKAIKVTLTKAGELNKSAMEKYTIPVAKGMLKTHTFGMPMFYKIIHDFEADNTLTESILAVNDLEYLRDRIVYEINRRGVFANVRYITDIVGGGGDWTLYFKPVEDGSGKASDAHGILFKDGVKNAILMTIKA
jgi:hypothetical protein